VPTKIVPFNNLVTCQRRTIDKFKTVVTDMVESETERRRLLDLLEDAYPQHDEVGDKTGEKAYKKCLSQTMFFVDVDLANRYNIPVKKLKAQPPYRYIASTLYERVHDEWRRAIKTKLESKSQSAPGKKRTKADTKKEEPKKKSEAKKKEEPKKTETKKKPAEAKKKEETKPEPKKKSASEPKPKDPPKLPVLPSTKPTPAKSNVTRPTFDRNNAVAPSHVIETGTIVPMEIEKSSNALVKSNQDHGKVLSDNTMALAVVAQLGQKQIDVAESQVKAMENLTAAILKNSAIEEQRNRAMVGGVPSDAFEIGLKELTTVLIEKFNKPKDQQ
jgi:outer membrane biosynthesis protein TonB